MSKRITITLNDKTEREIQAIMQEFGFATQSQAANYAIATWMAEHKSSEFWMSHVSKMMQGEPS